jgi:hypothetical protein
MATKARKLVFDDITMKKLSGLLPARNSYVVNVTPKIYDDLDEQYRPTYSLTPLSNGEMQQIIEMNKGVENDDNEQKFMTILRNHIVNFNNVIDISTGEDIKFEKDISGGITEELFNIIPKLVQASLVQELVNISGFKS